MIRESARWSRGGGPMFDGHVRANRFEFRRVARRRSGGPWVRGRIKQISRGSKILVVVTLQPITWWDVTLLAVASFCFEGN